MRTPNSKLIMLSYSPPAVLIFINNTSTADPVVLYTFIYIIYTYQHTRYRIYLYIYIYECHVPHPRNCTVLSPTRPITFVRLYISHCARSVQPPAPIFRTNSSPPSWNVFFFSIRLLDSRAFYLYNIFLSLVYRISSYGYVGAYTYNRLGFTPPRLLFSTAEAVKKIQSDAADKIIL